MCHRAEAAAGSQRGDESRVIGKIEGPIFTIDGGKIAESLPASAGKNMLNQPADAAETA
jgi:hypothetical protein